MKRFFYMFYGSHGTPPEVAFSIVWKTSGETSKGAAIKVSQHTHLSIPAFLCNCEVHIETDRLKVADNRAGDPMRPALSFLLVFFLAAVSLAEELKDSNIPQKERCPVCGMFVSMFPDWNARIEFKDSAYATFDGAKCMSKYYLNMKKYNPSKDKNDVTAITVMDYYSKTSINALQAFFVIWSDVYGPMGHELIPFEKETDAKKFLKEHKGKKILRFKDITPKIITSLDHP